MGSIGVLQYARFFEVRTISAMAQKLGVPWPPRPLIYVRDLIQTAGHSVAYRSDGVEQPWAVLLCKFSDDLSEPFPRSFYENLFSISGTRTMNLTDFFRDASQRKLDMTGCTVFGWFILDQKRSDYKGRQSPLVNWAKQKASEEHVDLSPFAVIVVSMNVPTDLFGSTGYAVCDDGIWPNGESSLSPSVVGQEMGHGYGLAHSRADGFLTDYGDPWDVMSTLAANMAPSPTMTQLDARGRTVFWIGPMLNAANMSGRGWLNGLRVWNAASSVPQTVILRPLAKPDLPGWIAARISDYFVEFRVKEGWDANIPRPAVLVHRFQGNQSYIMLGTKGNKDLVAGDIFQVGDLGSSPWTTLQVVNIDPDGYTATVQMATG